MTNAALTTEGVAIRKMRSFDDMLARESFPQVDAARLLLILVRFASNELAPVQALTHLPQRPYWGHFTPEYYLHKLDFLLRYPSYFVSQLQDLYQHKKLPAANNAEEIKVIIREVVNNREPTLMTLPFIKFWRGAYEQAASLTQNARQRERLLARAAACARAALS